MMGYINVLYVHNFMILWASGMPTLKSNIIYSGTQKVKTARAFPYLQGLMMEQRPILGQLVGASLKSHNHVPKPPSCVLNVHFAHLSHTRPEKVGEFTLGKNTVIRMLSPKPVKRVSLPYNSRWILMQENTGNRIMSMKVGFIIADCVDIFLNL